MCWNPEAAACGTYAWHVLVALMSALVLPFGPVRAQSGHPSQGTSFADDGWRLQEMERGRALIRQHDFSPIQDAFARRDVPLLWSYYLGSYGLTFQLSERATAANVANLQTISQERAARMQLALEQSQVAAGYLKQVPGHARFVGDLIEKSLIGQAGGMGLRGTYLESLIRLGQEGSDESIEQLGRYLYDERDPGFRPRAPAEPQISLYDTRGLRRTVGDDAVSSLLAVLRERFPIGKSLMTEGGPHPVPVADYAEKVRQWWLTSDEAAPCRRSLADSGVVLPPGYPSMKELQGAKSTIAPPLKMPPYPDGLPESLLPAQTPKGIITSPSLPPVPP